MYAARSSRGCNQKVSMALYDSMLRTYQNILSARLGIVLEVQPDKMLSKPAIELLVHVVEHQIQQIESRDERRRQVKVLRDGLVPIVLRPDGIGGSQDRRARVQRRDDPRLGDRDGLLFLENGPGVRRKELVRGRRRTMTSCRTLRVASDILSNSSMQQTPPSDSTRAPLCVQHVVSRSPSLNRRYGAPL